MGDMTFKGYRRSDGRIGIRNHVLVIPTVSCVNRVAMDIANKTGAVTFLHPYGCTFDAEENRITDETFIGHGRHPNVGAVLVVSLGCETSSAKRVTAAIAESGKPVELLIVQKEGRLAYDARPRGVHRPQDAGVPGQDAARTTATSPN